MGRWWEPAAALTCTSLFTASGVWTWTYDAAGNTIARSQGASAETWEYEFDARGLLIGATQSATSGGSAMAQVTFGLRSRIYGSRPPRS